MFATFKQKGHVNGPNFEDSGVQSNCRTLYHMHRGR